MPRSRIALEIGTHRPWISRLSSALDTQVSILAGTPACAKPPYKCFLRMAARNSCTISCEALMAAAC